MVKKRLPTGKEVWARIPRPALARKTLRTFRSGFYVFRCSEGETITGKPLFKVEVRNIFGLFDDFCELFTEDFSTKEDAYNFLDTCRREAKKEYQRLKLKQRERIKNHDKRV